MSSEPKVEMIGSRYVFIRPTAAIRKDSSHCQADNLLLSTRRPAGKLLLKISFLHTPEGVYRSFSLWHHMLVLRLQPGR